VTNSEKSIQEATGRGEESTIRIGFAGRRSALGVRKRGMDATGLSVGREDFHSGKQGMRKKKRRTTRREAKKADGEKAKSRQCVGRREKKTRRRETTLIPVWANNAGKALPKTEKSGKQGKRGHDRIGSNPGKSGK